ncbi:putative caffeoyl-CoA O-methyltransferase [Vitis vinifera]|uniref:Putative caffeoyl-CoA O-methyltransferase n=1 Tax=Vitis vinifera TaxID=29760 RepID=A0A438IHW4_VITVI|nr:putative caffeoyl-CoA O-methyltransferase [Vitis vinifera]
MKTERWAAMATTPDSGQLLAMLLKVANAKKTIEIGVFTGYSLLLTALSIPDDGKIIAIDIDRHTHEMGLPVIKKAGVEHKINFIESQALPVLDKLLEDIRIKQPPGVVVVLPDRNKVNSKNYHERLMKLVKIDGVVVCDNVFRRGCVAMPEELSGKKNPSKGLLQSEELYKYILEASVYPREPKPLKELRDITATHPKAVMATAPDAGQLMDMLLRLVNAKKTIEIGVFTGYSLLLTALSIPDDGKITAIDVDRQAYEMGLPVIRKAGVEHKINFIEIFDFAFVDADKINYKNYHERLMKLLKMGGIVVYDNTLRGGTVAMPEELVAENLRENRWLTIELNNFLAADPRVQICLAPLGDGITICRRVC